MLSHELLPFSISEIEKRPLNSLIMSLIQSNSFVHLNFSKNRALGLSHHIAAKKYLKMGGLPGVCFVRDEWDRKDLVE